MDEQRLQEIAAMIDSPFGVTPSAVRELVEEVRSLQAKLQAARMDAVNYARAKELLASTEAQVGSLIRQRDEALAALGRDQRS